MFLRGRLCIASVGDKYQDGTNPEHSVGTHLSNLSKHKTKHKRKKTNVLTWKKYAQAQAQEKETSSFFLCMCL